MILALVFEIPLNFLSCPLLTNPTAFYGTHKAIFNGLDVS